MLSPNELEMMAQVLDEAAGHLRAFMETELAEQRQMRHFLPDEMEGCAIMLRSAVGVPTPEGGRNG
jgi:hypothetical protein